MKIDLDSTLPFYDPNTGKVQVDLLVKHINETLLDKYRLVPVTCGTVSSLRDDFVQLLSPYLGSLTLHAADIMVQPSNCHGTITVSISENLRNLLKAISSDEFPVFPSCEFHPERVSLGASA